MKKFRLKFLFIGCIFLLIATACSNEDELTEGDIQATVDAAVQATTVALVPPTFTPIPTVTPLPTETPLPPEPTETPTPTATFTPSPTPTPEAPFVPVELGDGTVRYSHPFDGFALTLPDTWLVADIYEVTDSPDKARLESLLGSGLFRSLLAAGVKFYAINWDPVSRDSISPVNINVSEFPSQSATLEEGAAEWVEQFTYQLELSQEDIVQSASTLGTIPTQRLEYSLTQVNPVERDITLQFVQHVVKMNDRLLLVTITAPAEIAPDFLPDAEEALQSLEIFGE